jgi:putative CocE/NonD family hydrolase
MDDKMSEKNTLKFGEYDPDPPQFKGIKTFSTYVSMRDGVDLAVEVVLPRGLTEEEQIPALLNQTRYWRATELRTPFKWVLNPDNLNPRFKDFKPYFTSHGYALVYVDVRGTGASFGTWPYPWPPESIEDSRDIVDWIISQPWSNGKVGGYGISYVGTTADLLPVLNHPAVKAVIPQFNHPDAYTDNAFPGGLFNQRFVRDWGHLDAQLDRNVVPDIYGSLARMVVKGVKPVDGSRGRSLLHEAVLAHQENAVVFELAKQLTFRDQSPEGEELSFESIAVDAHREAIENSGAAIFGWGSWMDAGTGDAVIRRFLTYPNNQRAVIGAWEHGGQFHASPFQRPGTPVSPSIHAQWAEMIHFFDAYLKDADNGVREEKTLFYYTVGEEQWKSTSVWPPENTQMERWYFAEDNLLSPGEPSSDYGSDRYEIDFKASSGDLNRWWELSGALEKTVTYSDRANAGNHMLSYTSPPLESDMEITGHPIVRLYVASTDPDGAFYVYLEDIDDNGHVAYITDGQLRAIHRKVSNEKPPYETLVPYHTFKQADAMPLVPGEVAGLTFGLLPTSVLVRKGHRIRIGIAGHDEGTFTRVPLEGFPVISMERNKLYPSHIELPVVKA